MPRPVGIHQPLLKFYNLDGSVCANGTLTFYEPGTTTLLNIYTDSTLGTALNNPLDLDSYGSPVTGGNYTQIWVNQSYKLVVKNSSGNTQFTLDNLTELGIINSTSSKTGNYTILQTDKDKIFLCDATSASFTLTLPDIATVGSGFMLYAKKTDSSANTVTVSPVNAQTIDSGSTYTLSSQNDAIIFISGTSNWHVLGAIVNANSNIVTYGTVASAVNTVKFTNAATGNGPIVGNAGTDTNIDLNITSKGSGVVKLNGGSTARAEVRGTSGAAGGMRIYEDTANGTNYVGWKAPSSVTSNVEFQMPSADGSANYVLKTDGSAATSFFDVTTLFTQTVFASLLTQTAATSGTIRLGSIRVNWGTVQFPAATAVTATYATAFSASAYAVVIGPQANFTPYVSSHNSSGATFTATSNSNNISYIAIGPN